MKKLFIGNLAYATSVETLRAFFESHGRLSSVNIAMDRDTGRSRGFGFVEFEDEEEANSAISALNGAMLDGKQLVVNEARPREDRPRTGGAGRSFGGGGGGFNRGGRSGGSGGGERSSFGASGRGGRGGYSGGGRGGY